MKHVLVVNQLAVSDAGMIGKVRLEHACLLSYLYGWHKFAKANTVTKEDRKFVWVDYGNAVEELPMLFNPCAAMRSRKNQLSIFMDQLRILELIETTKDGRRLYFRLTGLGLALASASRRGGCNRQASVTAQHDNSVTTARDETVTQKHDDSGLTINKEPNTNRVLQNGLIVGRTYFGHG